MRLLSPRPKTPSLLALSLIHIYIDTGFPRLIEIENKGGTVVETIVKEYEDRNSCGVAETQEAVSYTHLDVYKRQI